MSSLNEYLSEKRDALAARKLRIDSGELGATPLAARVTAEGRSGIRRIRIRNHQVITDSPPDFAGYDLGPSSPELQLGVLGSCLTHSYLIQAALLGVEIETIEVELSGELDARVGRPGFESVPVYPHGLAFAVHITSPAPRATIAQLEEAVERACPILNLLRSPQTIRGHVEHRQSPVPHAEAA
jgi:uncharacterized OsmC-like protein